MIYLDYNATTPCAPEVLQEMLPYFTQKFGNPAATTYQLAWQADEAVKIARQEVADALGVLPEEIVFTSGSTESINLAIKGWLKIHKLSQPEKKFHIITSAIEHAAVLDTCADIENDGHELSVLPVNAQGLIQATDLINSIQENTILIAIQYANNENGVMQNIQELTAIAKERKIVFFSDTTQVFGKMECKVKDLGIDMACVSGHKIYGPKGVGALYISRKNPRVRLHPLMHGGGHEKGRRSGTLNVPGIVGLGKACARIPQNLEQMQQVLALRNKLEKELKTIEGLIVYGENADRLPNCVQFGISNVNAKLLIGKINNDLAISIGSACNAADSKPSHVLQAMNIPANYLDGSFRMSLGIYSTEEEIIQAVHILKTALKNQIEN